MKNQTTFSDVEYQSRKHISKKEEFLDAMNKIIPWDRWVNLIQPYYPSGKRGRPVRGIETMLRMYLLQLWFNLSDAGVEDVIYDSYCMRKFMGLDFSRSIQMLHWEIWACWAWFRIAFLALTDKLTAFGCCLSRAAANPPEKLKIRLVF